MDASEYKITTFISRGRNPVYEAIHLKTKSVKCIKLIQIYNEMERIKFLKEVQILQMTKEHPHDNIIQFDSFYFEEKQLNANETYTTGCIVMEKGITNLHNFLQKKIYEHTDFESYQVAEFINQMLSTHTHLQRIGIAHRDIKPQNIILFNQDNLLFKVCDVGFSTYSPDDITKTHTIGGTPPYLSPELFTALQISQPQGQYNPQKSDVFSLGLVFLYFITLEPIDLNTRITLYQDVNKFKAYLKKQRKIVKMKHPKLIGITKILKQMLEINANLRVDFIQLSQIIEANEYLALKSPGKNTHSNWQSVAQFDEMFLEIPDHENICLDFNHIGKSPAEIVKLLDRLARQCKHYDIRSFKIKLELNNLNVRMIGPLAKLLSRTTKLEELELHLWNNKLGNLGLLLLCQSMAPLAQLKRLYFSISNNIITEKGILQSLDMLKYYSKVEDLTLDFGMNQLPIECCEPFFKLIASMPKLVTLELNLESNHMNLVISRLLNQTIKQLPHVIDLNINFSNNILMDEGLFEIGDIIQKLHRCTLVLWSCLIKDHGVQEFAKGLPRCTNLKEFNFILWNNEVTELGCEYLAEYLVQLKTVETMSINLSNNKIGDKGVRSLAKAISEMPHLRDVKLLLDNVKCTSFGLRYVSIFIQNLKLLLKVNINFRANDINIQGVELLYVAFKQAVQLNEIVITLDDNPLQDEAIITLMKGLQKVRSLERLVLNLESVQATGNVVALFLDSVQSWPYLTEYTVNFQKNDTDYSDMANCQSRILQMKSQAKINIYMKEKDHN